MEQIDINKVHLNTADIVLFGNNNIISRVIKWFSYREGDTRDQIHHSGTISRGGFIKDYPDGAEIVESWARVVETSFLYRGFYPGARIEVWRSKNISVQDKEKIGLFLKKNKGRFYGFKYIPLYGLDLLLSKLLNRRVFHFRSKVKNMYNVICSVLTLMGYFNLGYKFGLDSPYYATPEYLQDWMQKNPDKWELVYVLRYAKVGGVRKLQAFVS